MKKGSRELRWGMETAVELILIDALVSLGRIPYAAAGVSSKVVLF